MSIPKESFQYKVGNSYYSIYVRTLQYGKVFEDSPQKEAHLREILKAIGKTFKT